MEKREFFDQIHAQLAEKHNISASSVRYIRYHALGMKNTQGEILRILTNKIQTHGKRTPKKHWRITFNFIISCSSEIWDDVIQKTKFDR